MPNYRLRKRRLQEAAASHGDHTNYAIAKRTGLDQTILSRACRGLVQPSAGTLLTLATTYGLSIDDLIDRDGGAQGEGNAA